jgi:hypothetical protein
MSEANNGQDPAHTPAQRKPKRHNAKLCPLTIRERIINALATGDSHRAIARGWIAALPRHVRRSRSQFLMRLRRCADVFTLHVATTR